METLTKQLAIDQRGVTVVVLGQNNRDAFDIHAIPSSSFGAAGAVDLAGVGLAGPSAFRSET